MIRRALGCIVLAAAVSSPSAGAEGPGASPGIGSLVWRTPAGPVDLPVLRIELDLDVQGLFARATLVEEFTNPTSEVLEAEYVLPLPERGTVHAMEMRIGERRIVSQVRERAEARVAYDAARDEGKKAALVEQQRPNLFTTAVTGILAGETVLVRIEVLVPVEYVDGELRVAFPLTYTPRYGAPIGSPSTAALTLQTAPPPSVTIHATVDPGFPARSIESPSHVVRSVRAGRSTHVEPIGNPVVADRDFELRVTPDKPAGSSGAVFVEDRPEGRYATAMLLPPAPLEQARGLPTETLFVVDVSGSMEGSSLDAAREALLAAIDRLRPDDTFNILKFSDASEPFRGAALRADDASRAVARAWVRALQAGGGTELVPALVRATDLSALAESSRSRRVVLVTDGAVSNEEEAFAVVAARLHDTRLHIVGIGSAPNRHLLRKLARQGRGTCDFLATAAAARERIDALFRRIERPVLTDIAISWEGAAPIEPFPERIPDLYSGEPLVVSMRLGIEHPGTRLVLTGRDEHGPIRQTLEIAPGAPLGSGIAIAWARAKVDALLDRLTEGADPEEVRREVVEVATRFGLVTRYTSLVAVEEAPSAPDVTSSVRVASESPAGSEIDGATLPQGGTLDPLVLRVGALLSLAGIVLLSLARRTSR